MDFIRTVCRRISPLVVAAFGLMCLNVPAVQAGMIGPSTYITQQQQADVAGQRQELQQFLARDDVRAQLIELGVDPAQAQARVDGLSPQEVATVAEQMQQLPAGGSVVGAIVFIFLVLLITDLLGLTDVFPFVKK